MALVLSIPLYAQEMTNAVPDKNNKKVIKRYNSYQHRSTYSGGEALPLGYTAVFGVKQNSVMSTDDIEVNVVKNGFRMLLSMTMSTVCISWKEDNSPYYRSFQIAYSKDEDFSTYTLLPINFYMRQLIGGFYPELFQKDRFFERLGGDQYTITNCEYGYGGIDRYRKVEN